MIDLLTHTLARTHDICRIDCFICTDQHKTVAVISDCRKCGFISAKYVVFDRLARTSLHEWHMLVCRRMVDDLRFILFKHTLDSAAVTYRSNQYSQIQFREVMS